MSGASEALLPSEITQSLRRHEAMRDGIFDRVFPRKQRFRSWLHWTPVKVAARVVALLEPTPATRLLDVGAGVGKMCLIGAAMSAGTWTGIERDLDMVQAAQDAAREMGLAEQAQFVHGDAAALDWSAFNAFYLYNPFAEILAYGTDDPLTRREHYVAAILQAQERLALTGAGTRVITYHGFGGELPAGFECVHREPARDDELCLWIRQSS